MRGAWFALAMAGVWGVLVCAWRAHGAAAVVVCYLGGGVLWGLPWCCTALVWCWAVWHYNVSLQTGLVVVPSSIKFKCYIGVST